MERLRTLSVDDRTESQAVWGSLFDDSPSFIQWFFGHRFSPATSVCLEQDGRIVSIAHGWPMEMRIRGVIVPAMAVSGVATLPEYRKRGYMHRVMTRLLELCREQEFPVAFCHPVRLQAYASLGYSPCGDKLLWTQGSGESRAVPLWSPWPDTQSLTDCYNAATSDYSACVVRSPMDTERKMEDYRCDGATCLTLWESGRLTGYLIATPGEGGRILCEEALALSPARYEQLLSLLPAGASVKLPPELPFPGVRTPYNVCAAANLPRLLAMVCGDPALTVEVSGSPLPSNNGRFAGTGRTTDRTADYTLSVGECMQALSGYLPLGDALPPWKCYCVEEY